MNCLWCFCIAGVHFPCDGSWVKTLQKPKLVVPAVNLKILIFFLIIAKLICDCDHRGWVERQCRRGGKKRQLNGSWKTTIVEIHCKGFGVTGPLLPGGSRLWQSPKEYSELSVFFYFLFVFRYGKRSTPEQAVKWMLFGADSSQDAEPRWGNHEEDFTWNHFGLLHSACRPPWF